MAPRRNRRRGRGQRNGQLTIWKKHYNGSTSVGSTAAFARKNLEFAFDREFKVISVTLEVIANGPITAQIRGYGPQSKLTEIVTSGLFCVGLIPRRRTLRINLPWYPCDTSGDTVLCALDVLCDAKDEQQRIIKFVMSVSVLLSPEKVPAACPKSLEVLPTQAFNRRQTEEEQRGRDAAAGWALA